MNRDNSILATLRSLDPADRHIDPADARARADLHAILGTDPTPHPRQPLSRPARSPGRSRPVTTTRRVVLVTGAVAAAAVGMVVVPSLTGGDAAFATWTAAPAGISAQQQAQAAADCRANQESGSGAAADLAARLREADPVIAERRGAWTTVVLAGSDGFSALCITDDSAGLFDQGMIGSIGTPTDYLTPDSRGLVATSLGVGTMGAGDVSMIAGAAGPDVTGVVYHSRTHGDVTATVNQGHFTLWFPGDELLDAGVRGVTVQATYRDGTTTTQKLTL